MVRGTRRETGSGAGFVESLVTTRIRLSVDSLNTPHWHVTSADLVLSSPSRISVKLSG